MKRFTSVIVVFFISYSVFAQHADFKKLIKQTNTYFSVYEDLSPFGESYSAINELGLKKEDIKKEIAEKDYDNVLSTNKDSIMSYVAIQIIQDRIVHNIKKIIAHPDFKKCDIRKLLTSQLNIIKSEDNKLYNFSFDAKNGGTYQMHISIMHYTDYDLNKTGNNPPESEDVDAGFHFADDGYTNIYTISTLAGAKYVLIGYVRGCSYCFGSHVSLITFKNNTFMQEFYYSIDLRDYETGIDYHPETKTISVNYQTDDLAPDCVCENEVNRSKEETETGADTYEEGTVEEAVLETEQEVMDEEEPVTRQCSCTFVFDGKNFQLKNKSSEIIETE